MSEEANARTVIVTGGASGIGFAFARDLGMAGYRIVIADLAGAFEAAARLRDEGAEAIGIDADVASEEHVAAMANAAVDHFGGIYALINNAALFSTLQLRPFEQIPPAEWMRVMQVNTLGPFLCARAVVPAMRAGGGGRIVNIASTTAIKGVPMMLHYVASKGAMIAFTRALARELGGANITVNAIAPGFTLSDGILSNGVHEVIGESARTTSRSIQRDQTPQDIVGAAAFLLSEGAAFVSGQTLVVDGGSAML